MRWLLLSLLFAITPLSCALGAQPDSMQVSQCDTTALTTMELARLAMLKSIVQPGWGQWQNGQPFKAVLFAGIEVGMFYGIIRQHNRWQDLSQQARDTSDPELRYDFERRSSFYLTDRNKLLWWLLWFELFNITDAYVNAALADFDDSPDLSLYLLPDGIVAEVSFPLSLR